MERLRCMRAVPLLMLLVAGCGADASDEPTPSGTSDGEPPLEQPAEALDHERPMLCAEDAEHVARVALSWDLSAEPAVLVVESRMATDVLTTITLVASDGSAGSRSELGTHALAAHAALRLPVAADLLPQSKAVASMRARADVLPIGAGQRIARELSEPVLVRRGKLSAPTGDPEERFHDHAGLTPAERARIRASAAKPGVTVEAIVIEPGVAAADLAGSPAR